MSQFSLRKMKTAVFVSVVALGGSMAVAQDRPPDPAPGKDGFTRVTGDYVFHNLCQACHMPDAKGATGAGTFPALADNPKLAAKEYPITMVLFGRRSMPPFGVMLSDVQIANAVNFVRSNFGNKYADLVTPADVAKIRATEKVDGQGNIIGRQ